MAAAPLAVLVTVEIEPARVPAFLEAMKVDVEGSRKEDGCLRFDLLKDQRFAVCFPRRASGRCVARVDAR